MVFYLTLKNEDVVPKELSLSRNPQKACRLTQRKHSASCRLTDVAADCHMFVNFRGRQDQ